jgi:PAS domain S-box-containing protein/putative nucleotidyltransferase with HDIG domain
MEDRRILIVDDNEGARETLSEILREKGYSVTAVGTAHEAMAEAKRSSFALALIEVRLPDMDGIELLKELKSLNPSLLAFIITGRSSRENAIKVLKSGADDYFIKPLDMDDVLRRMEQGLRQAELVRRLGESEEKFRAIFESSNDAIMLLDEKAFIDCNEATLRVFGMKSKDEFLGFHPGELSPPTQADGTDSVLSAREKIAVALREGRNLFEWTHLRADGTPFPAEVMFSTMTVEGRTILQATVRDITERKRAVEDLDRLFNLSGSMACIIDFEGRFRRVSHAFEEVLGYSGEELLSRPVLDFIHPEDREKTLEVRETRLKKGIEILDFENRYICKDGSVRWLSWTSRPVPEDGIILAIAYDITRRKDDEKAFETLVSATSRSTGQEFFDGLVQELSRWLGADCCAVAEIRDDKAACHSMISDGRLLRDFVYDLKGTPCEKVVAGGYCEYTEDVRSLFPRDKFLADMGAEAYVGASLVGRDGRGIGILRCVARKRISLPPRTREVFAIMAARASAELERIKSEEARKESEEMVRAISETAQDAIVIIDDSGRVVYWNPAAVRLLGYEEEEAMGAMFAEMLVPEKPRDSFCKTLAEFQATGRCPMSGRTLEMNCTRKDGLVFPIEHSISMVRLKGRVYFIGMIRDISKRKDAEKTTLKETEITRNLLKITEAIAGTDNLDELLERIAQSTGPVTGSDVTLCYLAEDGPERSFVPLSSAGLERDQVPLFRAEFLDVDCPILREAFRSGPLFVPARREGEHLRWLREMGSLAVIPLKGKTSELGVLILGYRQERDGVDNRDMALLKGIGHHVSIAVEKARQAKEAIDRAMELSHEIETIEVMHEIDKTILSTLDPAEIRLIAVNMIGRVVSCERCTLRLVDRKRGGFVYAAGFQSRAIEEVEFVPFGETSTIEVLATSQPQYIYDLAKVENRLPFEQKLLEAGYVSHIRLPLIVKSEITGVLNLSSRRPAAFGPGDLSTLEKLSAQIVVALENSRLVGDLENLLISTIKTLSDTIDAKSPWTRGHSERVTALSLRLARKFGISGERLKDFEIGGLLHDIGKIGTYEEILNKPGRLSPAETVQLQKHPIKGAEILSNIRQFEHIVPLVRHHHEFYDGRGYPDGLKGELIPFEARILAVADTVDAMASDRPYRKGLPMEVIFKELERCSGKQFDPMVVKAFLGLARGEKDGFLSDLSLSGR